MDISSSHHTRMRLHPIERLLHGSWSKATSHPNQTITMSVVEAGGGYCR